MKKDVLMKAYIVTVVLIFAVVVVGQLLGRGAFNTQQNDIRSVSLARKEATLSQEISKSALSMEFANNEARFNSLKQHIFDLSRELEQIHAALQERDGRFNLTRTPNPVEIDELFTGIHTYYKSIITAADNLTGLDWNDDERTKLVTIRTSINSILNTEAQFMSYIDRIVAEYETQFELHKTGMGTYEIVLFVTLAGLLLLQAFLIFKPAINLAGKNFLSANAAFQRLKKSELAIRRSTERQMKINEHLILTQRSVRKKNRQLQESEKELLKRTEEQLKVNERMIVAERKLHRTLELEKKSKAELTQALDYLKATQSQLVQSEKMASLGQLTAGIAHEINNPINFVYNGIDTLKMSFDELMVILAKYNELHDTNNRDKVMDEILELREDFVYDELLIDIQELVSAIKKGAVRTIEIVKGLRVFSRLDEEELKRANVNESIDATLILLNNKTKNRIEVKKYYDETIEEINCFPGQLNQVFMNILNNAIQAIPEECQNGKLEIYTENQEEHVMIRIKDNGKGMSEQVKKRIFEPFFTTKEVGVGTGLGMSISYGIVEKHSGHIYVNSKESIGTEFSIQIPKSLEQKEETFTLREEINK